MSVQSYVASHIDPFDTTLPQPKILDGSEPRSSGIRFRDTGNVTLDPAGGVNYFVLLPGLSNALCWKRPADAAWQYSPVFPSHLGSAADRLNVQRARLVSCGVRFNLLNTTDDNEGYWEAVRIPVSTSNLDMLDFATYRIAPLVGYTLATMSNHHTFQRGLLRDLSRFQFKLNSVKPDHEFLNFPDGEFDSTIAASAPETASADRAFDMLVIKMVGRVDAVTPSTIMYDTVNNQEVVYTDGTALARLMNNNVMVPNTDVLLDQTRYQLPAIQIN